MATGRARMPRWRRGGPDADETVEGPDPDAPGDVLAEPGAVPPDDEHVTVVDVDDDEPEAPRTLRTRVTGSGAAQLLRAGHPRQALVTGAGLGTVALVSGRPLREGLLVAATAVVGQTILGWHNDLVDRDRDARHDAARKPVAAGTLESGSVWYAVVIAVLLVIPLSISGGVDAGTYYLGALVVGVLGNIVLRSGPLSFVSWAAQFALYAPYLSHGGWGGGAQGDPPEPVMVVLFALLGVGVHFLRAIWGLVADDEEGWTYLPLVLGRKLGATRLLMASATWTGLVLAAMVVVGGTAGLRQ